MLTVTTSFQAEIDNQFPSQFVKLFDFNGIEQDANVARYGSLKYDTKNLSIGNITLQVENAEQTYNSLITSKDQIGNTGEIKVGFSDTTTTDQITLFKGNFTRAKFNGKGKTSLTFLDKFDTLSKRKVGTGSEPVSFIGSSTNVASIWWAIVTSHGGLSNITSTSNPDIDFTAFETWRTDLDSIGYVFNAEITGQNISTITQEIAEITDSVFITENGKIKPSVYTKPDSADIALTGDFVKSINLEVNDDNLVNKIDVFYDYNVSSKTFRSPKDIIFAAPFDTNFNPFFPNSPTIVPTISSASQINNSDMKFGTGCLDLTSIESLDYLLIYFGFEKSFLPTYSMLESFVNGSVGNNATISPIIDNENSHVGSGSLTLDKGNSLRLTYEKNLKNFIKSSGRFDFWYNPSFPIGSSSPPAQNIINFIAINDESNRTPGGEELYLFRENFNQDFTLKHETVAGVQTNLIDPTSLGTFENSWHHFRINYNVNSGQFSSIHFNGTLVASKELTSTITTSAFIDLRFQPQHVSSGGRWKIDDLRIYNNTFDHGASSFTSPTSILLDGGLFYDIGPSFPKKEGLTSLWFRTTYTGSPSYKVNLFDLINNDKLPLSRVYVSHNIDKSLDFRIDDVTMTTSFTPNSGDWNYLKFQWKNFPNSGTTRRAITINSFSLINDSSILKELRTPPNKLFLGRSHLYAGGCKELIDDFVVFNASGQFESGAVARPTTPFTVTLNKITVQDSSSISRFSQSDDSFSEGEPFIWHATSASAQTFVNSQLSLLKEPQNETFIDLNFQGLVLQPGDTVSVVDSQLGLTASQFFRVEETTINLDSLNSRARCIEV